VWVLCLRSVSTYHGDLISGAMLFNKKFTEKWAQDGYRYVLSLSHCIIRPVSRFTPSRCR
jgi:hypothetical protein